VEEKSDNRMQIFGILIFVGPPKQSRSVLLAFTLLVAVPLDPAALQEAKQQYDKARYEKVVEQLRDADVGALPLTSRADALFILGVSELALGNDGLSQKAFIRLFSEAPDFELPPYTAPKVAAACERAKQQVAITLKARAEKGKVIVCGDGLPKRAQVKVVFVSATGEAAVTATSEPPCFAAEPAHAADVSGFYVAVSIDGEVRATSGSRKAPRLFAAASEESSSGAVASGTPWYKHWLTWTIVGIVVGGGATAAGIAIGVAQANKPSNDPGRVRVTVEVP
jgi:hypothetical protein